VFSSSFVRYVDVEDPAGFFGLSAETMYIDAVS
jgi:hypothetical protein